MRSIMAMLRPKGPDVAPLYAALVGEARDPSWYVEGEIPDTMDGRFALLSTLVALAILRLESGGESGVRASVALTEAYIADMDAQMREAGFGDPSIGKQVRHMVGALASRVDRWRPALEEDGPFTDAAVATLHRDGLPGEAASTFTTERLRRLHEGLAGMKDESVIAGKLA